MVYTLVGIKSMVGKKSRKGEELNSYILHLLNAESRDPEFHGAEVQQQFCRAELIAPYIKQVGSMDALLKSDFDLVYDRGGFLVDLKLCES